MIEEQWKARIRDALSAWQPTPKAVLMHLAVESFTRRGQRFDLDNLTTPVFEAIYGKKETNRPDARIALISWRATIAQSTTPFLLLDFLDKCLSKPVLTRDCRVVLDAIWPGPLPADSGPGDRGLPVWVRDNIGDHVVSNEDKFGVHLVFNNKTRYTPIEQINADQNGSPLLAKASGIGRTHIGAMCPQGFKTSSSSGYAENDRLRILRTYVKRGCYIDSTFIADSHRLPRQSSRLFPTDAWSVTRALALMTKISHFRLTR